ncbi:MAG: J domain-containing protein, partial [Candidatus Limnocylindrales bacterium]
MTGPGATDPYKVLQVDSEAEDEVIAAAYRRLARKYHPDAAGPEAAPRMAAINAAWEILGDSTRRAAFDRERALAAAMERARPTAPPTFPAPSASTDPRAATPPSAQLRT